MKVKEIGTYLTFSVHIALPLCLPSYLLLWMILSRQPPANPDPSASLRCPAAKHIKIKFISHSKYFIVHYIIHCIMPSRPKTSISHVPVCSTIRTTQQQKSENHFGTQSRTAYIWIEIAVWKREQRTPKEKRAKKSSVLSLPGRIPSSKCALPLVLFAIKLSGCRENAFF